MWEPNTTTNRNISVSEEKNINDNDRPNLDNKYTKDFDNSSRDQEDSGFMSGPQGQLTSEQLSEITTEKYNLPNITDVHKQHHNLNIDSGLIEDDDCIDKDDEDAQQQKQTFLQDKLLENQTEQMLLDSGVDLDVDVSERFYNLSLQNDNNQHHQHQITESINNLGSINLGKNKIQLKNNNFNELTSKKQQQPQIQQQQTTQPWENYYQQNEEGDTQLHLAIIHGFVDVAWALIRLSQPYSCLLGIQNDLSQAPMHLAVLTGQPTVVRSLLVAGAEATVRDRHGNSPLHLACINGNLACVKALTTPITSTEEQLRTSLKFTKTCVCPPDMEQRNYDGERCVHLATQYKNIDILRELVYSGADINAREGKSGLTPLHIAIEDNNTTLVNFLLEECPKIIIETKTYAGLTAYQLATLIGNRVLIKELVNNGAMKMSPPESDDDSDIEDNMIDRFDTPTFFQTFSGGANAINVS